MYIYLSLLALTLVFGVLFNVENSERGKRNYIITVFGLLTIVSSVRSISVGIDTRQFCSSYIEIGYTSVNELIHLRYEQGFIALCKALNLLSSNYQLLIVISSLIIYPLIGRFIYKESKNAVLSTFLFLGFCFYYSYMNIMRQAMAIAIVLFGLVHLKERKCLHFAIYVLLAALIHRTAWIALLFIPAYLVPFEKKHIPIYITLSGITFVFANQITTIAANILGRKTFYNEQFMGSNYFGPLIQVFLYSLIALFIIDYFELNRTSDFDSEEWSALEHAIMLAILFLIAGMRVQILSRFSYYFTITIIISLPLSLSLTESNETGIITMLLYFVSFTYFMIISIYKPEWYGVIPYTADLQNVILMLKSLL